MNSPQLAADYEEKITQLKQQLQDAHNLVEQIREEKAILETELQSQQVRYVLLSSQRVLCMYMYMYMYKCVCVCVCVCVCAAFKS